MKCYIYSIVNIATGKRYIGQTTNMSRRKSKHLLKLRNNEHVNEKLQNAFNKYGEDKFIFEVQEYDLTKDELNDLEKDKIKEYDSFYNGYNLTLGGDGGNTRKRRLDFKQFCFAYFGNKAFSGMTSKTGKFLNCDSSTISAIVRDISYDDFRERALLLPEEEKQSYLKEFVSIFNLNEIKPNKNPQKNVLENELVIDILCIVSSYSRGIETAVLEKFNLSKGFTNHVITKKYYKEAQKYFYNMSQEERLKRGCDKFEEYWIKEFCKSNLKIEYKDLYTKYSIDGSWLRN